MSICREMRVRQLWPLAQTASSAAPTISDIADVLTELSLLRRQLETLSSCVLARSGQDGARPHAAAGAQLYATLFGSFGMYRGDEPLQFGNQRPVLELCRYLIARQGQLVPRDELIELLWPDTDPQQAMPRLHVATSTLRRAVDQGGGVCTIVQFRDNSYIVPADTIVVDVDIFEERYRASQHRINAHEYDLAASTLEAALELYRGDYLADDVYAEWTFQRRAHFVERRLSMLMFLSEHAMLCRKMAAVVDYARQILEVDNLCERAHRDMMRAHYYLGQRASAVRQFRTCEAILREELGVRPSELTGRLHAAICSDSELPPEYRLYP